MSRKLDSIRNANTQESAALDTMQRDLDASMAYEHWKQDDLGQLCTDKASIFIKLQQWDSAAYYLCQRAELDTNNMDWQMEAGQFLLEQMDAPGKALLLYRRVLHYLTPIYGSEHPQVEFVNKEIERILKRSYNVW